MTAAANALRSRFMRMAAARHKIEVATHGALVLVMDLQERTESQPDALDRITDAAELRLIDQYVLQAAAALREFQEAAHG